MTILFAPPIVADSKHQDVFMCTFDLKNEMEEKIYEKMRERIYTDQTGKFLVWSSRGHQYIMVLIKMDSSYISMEPMKTRHASQMVQTYQIMIDRLKACGINPKKHVLDNECSTEFKEAIRVNQMTYEPVPPYNHRRNIAERVIQTAKIHIFLLLP